MKINRKLPKIKQNTNKVDMKNQTKKRHIQMGRETHFENTRVIA